MKRTVLKPVEKTGGIELDKIMEYLKEHLVSDHDSEKSDKEQTAMSQ